MPWDREQIVYIEQEMRADIEAVLDPEELELYDLYRSTTANALRARLISFAPTEEEFRALYELQKSFDERFSYTTMSRDPETMRERSRAQQELNDQFEAVLGQERYAALQRHMDRGYQAAARIVDHFKRPEENATAVYELTQNMEQRGRALRSNRDLAPEQRDAQLRELAVDASNRLDDLLTVEGAQAYRDSGAARWLSLLEPRSPTRPTSAP